ncbi:MAG: hypothetical protein N4A45_00530 [Flavobacteriales bacterium]|nr:hypothetical protein [Flavobacteriales bacterium]
MVNIISWISVIAITAATASMLVIMSGFFGFEKQINKMFSSFDPPLVIKHQKSSLFEIHPEMEAVLKQPEILAYSRVLEARSIFRTKKGKDEFGFIKGVEANYPLISKIDEKPFDGSFVNFKDSLSNVFMGVNLQAKLGLSVQNIYSIAEIWVPKASNQQYLDPTKAFRNHSFYVNGAFYIGNEYDGKYAFVSLKEAQKLTGNSTSFSAIELSVDPRADIEEVKNKLQTSLGKDFQVLNQRDQHAEMFGFIELEKNFIILIFGLIILIASFSFLGSITILMIEKKSNLNTLAVLGARLSDIRKIFWYLSALLSSIGLIFGLILGTIICLIQQNFELVRMGSSILSSAYPIDLRLWSYLLIILVVTGISLLTSSLSITKLKV